MLSGLRFPVWAVLFGALLISGAAQAAQVEGEILRITAKRTGVLVDLRGDTSISEGTAVNLTVDGKKRSGKVTKVTENGRAFIVLNKGLPKAVEVGDDIALEAAPAAGGVQLTRGGFTKAYWDEVSFVAAHRKSGARADVAVSSLNDVGKTDAAGGAIQDDTQYKTKNSHTIVTGDAGYVGRCGIGGGLMLNYDKASTDQTATIYTQQTKTYDDDQNKDTRTVQEFKPYVEFLSRAKTGDIGYGLGVGVPIQSITEQEDVTLASVESKAPQAQTTATGVALEGIFSTNSFAVVLQLTPVLDGKIKQGGESYTHKADEYGMQLETYAKSFKTRLGFDLANAKDAYQGATLTDATDTFSFRLDYDAGVVHVVPYLDYITETRKLAGDTGNQTTADFGARVALAGVYAPFLQVGLNILNQKETDVDGHTEKTAVSGVRFAGGIDI